MKKKV
jgi:hypothetical protein